MPDIYTQRTQPKQQTAVKPSPNATLADAISELPAGGFENALKFIKAGFCAYRSAWQADGKGMRVILVIVPGDHPPHIELRPQPAVSLDEAKIWEPGRHDLLAHDWVVTGKQGSERDDGRGDT